MGMAKAIFDTACLFLAAAMVAVLWTGILINQAR
jgi:hypothetical protein